MNQSSGIRVLVPAAGTGSRMAADRPKQYLPLLGRPLIQHTVSRLAQCPAIAQIFIGISEHDPWWAEYEPAISQMPAYAGTFPGGAERAHTVLNGLQSLVDIAREDDWILIHDAARPCVRCHDIGNLVEAVHSHAGSSHLAGGLLGLPVSDTVKRTNDLHEIMETVPRQNLWRALTPQMFRFGELKAALARAIADGIPITDEASAMEYAGARPLMVAGHADNIKVTTPRDLELAAMFLQQQESD